MHGKAVQVSSTPPTSAFDPPTRGVTLIGEGLRQAEVASRVVNKGTPNNGDPTIGYNKRILLWVLVNMDIEHFACTY